ncbi:GNAT family N-acetyltransferase [Seonamhaeicola sp. MEBiC1930]|uniref:GNAT family N-acetyltransferase n=1 Tax=Seonamhaeicola sp. MEBiC01930 TaxID=2976768 RepID=UPI0032479175
MAKTNKFKFLDNHNTIIPQFYESISINNKNILNKQSEVEDTLNRVLIVSLHPTYLETYIKNQSAYIHKKIKQIGPEGAGMLFDENYTVDSYLNKFTKRQLRKNLRRAISSLEQSFEICYEYNYGNITKEKCDSLTTSLFNMINMRFEEKKTKNLFIQNWESNTKNLYNLINQKKASLFVVYADKKPISISLNRHFSNSILYSESHSYDLDYSQFSLGHLDNYLLLKWCLENNYDFLDLGMGAYDYKKKWCNTSYYFNYHMYYEKNSIWARIIAQFEMLKMKTKNSIKSLLLIFKININE